MKLLFVGAGKMATAIAGGIISNGAWNKDNVLAADVSEQARKAFEEATGAACSGSAAELTDQADIILLAVKPQVAAEAVAPFADACKEKLIVSICAGITIESLREWFGTDRVVRVMPNTPMMVGKGASGFTCAPGVACEDRQAVETLLESVGIAREVDESLMDAVTALSGSGPAYFFEMIRGLIEAAVEIGLEEQTALQLAAQTAAGAAEMVAKRMATPEDLRNAVTSPGGTTAAGLAVFEKHDFPRILQEVVTAARDRSVELGKK